MEELCWTEWEKIERRRREQNNKKGKRTEFLEGRTDFNTTNYEDFVPVRSEVSLRVTSLHAFNTAKYAGM